MAEARLGDTIEDWCPTCRHLLDHNVAAIVSGEVRKVVCNTCFNEHPFRHGKGARTRTKNTAKDLFNQVLSGMPRPASPPAPQRRKGRSRKKR